MADSLPTIEEILGEFDAGIFMQKVEEALKQVALGVVNNGGKGKKGRLRITLDVGRINEFDMVNVDHSLVYEFPTLRGKKSESNKTSSAMYVNREGVLTVSSQVQGDVFVDGNNVTTFNKGGK